MRRLLPLLNPSTSVQDGTDRPYTAPATDRGRDSRRAPGPTADLLLRGRLRDNFLGRIRIQVMQMIVLH